MEDRVTDEEEIEWAVKRLRNNRAGGPSRMRAGDLKGWLAAAQRGEKEETADKEGGGGHTGGGGELGEGSGFGTYGFQGW